MSSKQESSNTTDKRPKHTFKIGWIKGYETFNYGTSQIEVVLVDERDNTLVELKVSLDALTKVVDFLDRNRTLGSLKNLHKSINDRN